MLPIGVLLCFSLFLADIMIGSSGMSLWEVLATIFFPDQAEKVARVIVWDLRLPIAFMGLAVGAALGLSGAVMQTILNNPLASPYTLGLSAGAGFGASLAMVVGFGSITTLLGPFVITVSAFAFSLLACFGIYTISRTKGFTSSIMVLSGIGMVFFFQAGQSFLQYIASDEALSGIVFWTFGSLTKASWIKAAIVIAVYIVIFAVVYANAWKLTAVSMGDERARALGVQVDNLRRTMFVCISLLTATAVSFVGSIGFVGIVGPHMARILLGEDQRYYLPMSAICGAAILSAASVASKAIIPGAVFPIGILTSLLGVPVFFLLIMQKRW